MKLLITDIVKKECLSHLQEAIQKALSGLNTFRRQGIILLNIEDQNIKKLFDNVDEKTIYSEAISQFEKYLEDYKVQLIECSCVNPQDVFNLYFQKHPPFGSGKKKSKFPDAFSLMALEKESKSKGTKV